MPETVATFNCFDTVWMDAKDVDVAVALVISDTCSKSPGSAQVRLKRKGLMRKSRKISESAFRQGGERAGSSFPQRSCGTATVSESMAAAQPSSLLRQLLRPDVCDSRSQKQPQHRLKRTCLYTSLSAVASETAFGSGAYSREHNPWECVMSPAGTRTSRVATVA